MGARRNVVQALNEVDFGNKTVSVRINAPGSQHMYRDVIDLIEKGGERLDMFIIPMCGTAADIYATDKTYEARPSQARPSQARPSQTWPPPSRLPGENPLHLKNFVFARRWHRRLRVSRRLFLLGTDPSLKDTTIARAHNCTCIPA